MSFRPGPSGVAGPRGRQIRPISEARLRFAPDASRDLFADVVHQSLRWLQARAGAALPLAAWRGESFESEVLGAQPTGAVRLDTPDRSWTAYLDDADRTVPQRRWITQISARRETSGNVLVGVRLMCALPEVPQPYVPSIPGVVRQVVDLGGATCEGRGVAPTPWLVRTASDVDALVALLVDPARRFHVIVCSLPDDSGEVAPVLDLHLRTLGASHVAALTRFASFLLTNRIGRLYSVFDGAVRTYTAGFNPAQDPPLRHPVAFRTSIEGWSGGPAGFAELLVGQALLRSVQAADQVAVFMSFTEAKRQEAQLQREAQLAAGASDRELLDLYEAENQTLRRRVDDADALLAFADTDRQGLEAERDSLQSEIFTLRSRIDALVAERTSRPEVVEPIPVDIEGFREWCASNLSGQVEVLPRASAAAKKSEYHDPRLLHQALLLLRDRYVPMRRGAGLELKEAFETEAAKLGLVEEPTFSSGGARWGEEGDTYVVQFHGRERRLDRHLKKGNDREARFCFRLYFFWDEETEQVVVGWLPSHLRTRAS